MIVHLRGSTMSNKKDLTKLLNISYENPIDEKSAIDSYNRFEEFISHADQETIQYFTKIVSLDSFELLELREKIAEIGYELTPEQMSQYIFILLMCLTDNIKPKQKGAN